MNFFDLAPGTQADWVAAIGTGAAFGVAAIGYVWNLGRTKKAQARRVFAHVDMGRRQRPLKMDDAMDAWEYASQWRPNLPRPVGVTDHREPMAVVPFLHIVVNVQNDSDEVMGPIRIDFYDVERDVFLPELSARIAGISPSATGQTEIVMNWPDVIAAQLLVRIIYRDSSGKWWHRLDAEPVQSAPYGLIDATSELEQLARELRWKRASPAKPVGVVRTTPPAEEAP